MHGDWNRDLNERMNREAHERLLTAAAEARKARSAIGWSRLFRSKKQAVKSENLSKAVKRSPAAAS